MTIRQLDLLIVVFDGANARFFERVAGGRLRHLNEWQSGLHAHVRDLVSDKPGRGFGSTHSGVRHAYESADDLHRLEKQQFVQRLVKTLDDAYDQGAFKHLLIAAPKRSIGDFHKLASEKLRGLLTAEVPKDLTKYPDHELEERLKPHLAALPVSAAAH